jgi:hypothetical protein
MVSMALCNSGIEFTFSVPKALPNAMISSNSKVVVRFVENTKGAIICWIHQPMATHRQNRDNRGLKPMPSGVLRSEQFFIEAANGMEMLSRRRT